MPSPDNRHRRRHSERSQAGGRSNRRVGEAIAGDVRRHDYVQIGGWLNDPAGEVVDVEGFKG